MSRYRWQHPKHPIWSLVRVLVFLLVFAFLQEKNAEASGATAHEGHSKTLVEMMLAMLGWEGVQQYLGWLSCMSYASDSHLTFPYWLGQQAVLAGEPSRTIPVRV